MITLESIAKISTAQMREAIERNISRRPTEIALDRRIANPSLVATQVKYLQRAATKLPSYYEARCIIPPLAFEQSSSEATAAIKRIEGESVLELTAGLGVDTLYLSRHFQRVVSLERDSTLAAVTAENLRRLGVSNVELHNTSAEEYLERSNESFDWIYVDPDRRGERGEKLVRLEDCSPNIIALAPQIAALGARLAIKLSPLFDVDECFRLFPDAHVEVVSLAGECKEVVIYTGEQEPRLSATAIGRGEFSAPLSLVDNSPKVGSFDAGCYRHLIIPDVALQKARLACHCLRGEVDIWSNNGFGFAAEEPQNIIGRTLEIERIERYDPKALRRELSGEGIEILKRDFPLSTAKILSQLKCREGGRRQIAFTAINGELLTIILRP